MYNVWECCKEIEGRKDISDQRHVPMEDSRPFVVGVIGCGSVGLALVKSMMNRAHIPAECIWVSTRQHAKLQELKEVGVRCMYDNRTVATQAQLLFLCCLPSHMSDVLHDIGHGTMTETPTILYSFPVGIPARKLCRVFGISSVIQSSLHWRHDNIRTMINTENWAHSPFAKRSLEAAKRLCPLHAHHMDETALLASSPEWMAHVLVAAKTLCNQFDLSVIERMRLINTIFLGTTANVLTDHDFRQCNHDEDDTSEVEPRWVTFKEQYAALVTRVDTEGVCALCCTQYNAVFTQKKGINGV